MEGLRDIAVTYYSKLTVEQKEEVQKYFRSMDGNGDGKIAISEFLDSLQIKEPSRSWYYRLFQDLDMDGNGSLDFTELITFYYLEKFTTKITCGGCRVILNGKTYFTCVHCFERRVPSFDLCRTCYSRNIFIHGHKNGVAPVFRDTSSLLVQMRNKNLAGQDAPVNNANVNANTAYTTREIALRGNTSHTTKVIVGAVNTFKAVSTLNTIVQLIGNCTIM